jgi:hypothetical protein
MGLCPGENRDNSWDIATIGLVVGCSCVSMEVDEGGWETEKQVGVDMDAVSAWGEEDTRGG